MPLLVYPRSFWDSLEITLSGQPNTETMPLSDKLLNVLSCFLCLSPDLRGPLSLGSVEDVLLLAKSN